MTKDGVELGCAADLTGFADLVEYALQYLSSLGWYERVAGHSTYDLLAYL